MPVLAFKPSSDSASFAKNMMDALAKKGHTTLETQLQALAKYPALRAVSNDSGEIELQSCKLKSNFFSSNEHTNQKAADISHGTDIIQELFPGVSIGGTSEKGANYPCMRELLQAVHATHREAINKNGRSDSGSDKSASSSPSSSPPQTKRPVPRAPDAASITSTDSDKSASSSSAASIGRSGTHSQEAITNAQKRLKEINSELVEVNAKVSQEIETLIAELAPCDDNEEVSKRFIESYERADSPQEARDKLWKEHAQLLVIARNEGVKPRFNDIPPNPDKVLDCKTGASTLSAKGDVRVAYPRLQDISGYAQLIEDNQLENTLTLVDQNEIIEINEKNNRKHKLGPEKQLISFLQPGTHHYPGVTVKSGEITEKSLGDNGKGQQLSLATRDIVWQRHCNKYELKTTSLQVNGWPDKQAIPLDTFVEVVEEVASLEGSTLAGCNAGAGRTGTVYAGIEMRDLHRAGIHISRQDVLRIAASYRDKVRLGVQTPSQLRLLLDYAEYLNARLPSSNSIYENTNASAPIPMYENSESWSAIARGEASAFAGQAGSSGHTKAPPPAVKPKPGAVAANSQATNSNSRSPSPNRALDISDDSIYDNVDTLASAPIPMYENSESWSAIARGEASAFAGQAGSSGHTKAPPPAVKPKPGVVAANLQATNSNSRSPSPNRAPPLSRSEGVMTAEERGAARRDAIRANNQRPTRSDR